MSTRVTTIQDVVNDITNTPVPYAAVSIKLVVPGGVRATDNQGYSIAKILINLTADVSGVWAQALIPPGDITPAGCYYQIVENGVTINSPSFAYSGSPIAVSTWFVAASVDPTQLLMYLQLAVIDNSYDSNDTVTYSISDNCIWTAKGIGLVKGVTYPVATDTQGRAFIYLVPNSLLNPNNVPYIASYGGGQSFFFTVPATPNQWQGNWSNTTAYVANDVVNLSGTWYICILGHTGHTPPNATYWALWNGENILNPTGTHLSSGSGAGVLTLPDSAISHDAFIPSIYGDPATSPLTLQDDLVNLTARIARNSRGRKLFLSTHVS